MKYKLWFRSGQSAREAASMKEAIRIARVVLGCKRIYKGAKYWTDEPDGDEGLRREVQALDLWQARVDAKAVRGTSADCVVTW